MARSGRPERAADVVPPPPINTISGGNVHIRLECWTDGRNEPEPELLPVAVPSAADNGPTVIMSDCVETSVA